MGFLSKIGGAVKSGFNKLTDLLDRGGSQVANLQQALTTDKGPGFDPRSGVQRSTPQPNMSLVGGGLGAADAKGNIVGISGNTAIPLTFNNPRTGATQNTRAGSVQFGQPRGALPAGSVQRTIDQATGGQDGGQSSAFNSGGFPNFNGRSSGGSKRERGERTPFRGRENGVEVFYDEFGRRQELGGVAGAAGASSLQSFAGSPQFQSGPSGSNGLTGGSPNFTGTLTTVGGLGGNTALPDGEDEASEAARQGVTSKDIQSTIDQFAQQGLQTIAPARDTLTSAMNAAHSQPGIANAAIGNEFNAGEVGASLQGGPVDRTTIGDTLATIQQNAFAIKQFLDEGGLDENVVDTVEQLSFIEQSGDPFGISQAMDNFRRQETNLIQIQNQIQEVFNGINAVTQSYEAVYKDIRENPNLPKGLAQRRLEQLYGKEKGVLDNLTQQLQQLGTMKDDQNNMVNRAFNIVQSAEDREQSAFQNNMQMLNFYINSGAIGGFSDRDIADMSQAFGIGEKGLRHIRDTKLREENKRDLGFQRLGNGDLVVVDNDKGTIVSNLGGRSVSGGSGGTNLNQQTDNERALMNTFQQNPIVKDYNQVISQKLIIDQVIENGVGGPADLNLVFNFMKGLDPNSVVRESEYKTAAESGNIFAGKFARFNGYFRPEGGFLPESVKLQFQNLVNQSLEGRQAQYENFAKTYRGIAERQGLNPENVVVDFGGALSPQEQALTQGQGVSDQEAQDIYSEVTSTPQTEDKGFFKSVFDFFF